MRLISLGAERLVASQEELRSMELVMSLTVRALSQKNISELSAPLLIIL
jgi:hypothetical protein